MITEITASNPLTRAEISDWAAGMRRSWKKHVTIKTVAVITRAFKIIKDRNPMSVQVMSILLVLCKVDGKIRLQQVSIGSGKSAIIATVAVARVLEGHNTKWILTLAVLCWHKKTPMSWAVFINFLDSPAHTMWTDQASWFHDYWSRLVFHKLKQWSSSQSQQILCPTRPCSWNMRRTLWALPKHWT